jgi:integrase
LEPINDDDLKYSEHNPIVQTRSLSDTMPTGLLSQSCTRRSSPQSAGLLGLDSLAQEKEEGEVQICEQLQNSDLLKNFPDQLKPKLLQYAAKEWSKGRSVKSVETYIRNLKQLVKHGADLFDPNSVAETIAQNSEWANATKVNKTEAYDSFLKFQGGFWQKPKYRAERKLPFLPLETEIDQLIAGTSKTVAAALQVAKETAARLGEIGRLKWTDVDFERRLIAVNEPEKGSNPRIIPVTAKCVEMLSHLPRKGERIFKNIKCASATLIQQRNHLAYKLGNPRLRQIHFHTLRHWKATMEYHKRPDPFYLRDFLGHKNLKNTEIYVTVERTIFQTQSSDFTVKVASTLDEFTKLLEVGFEYVCDYGDRKVLRKRG